MDATEKHVMAWVSNMWESAEQYGHAEWHSLCEALYGATQACNQVDEQDDYEAYSFLANIARQRRIDCVTSKYKEAA